jgi:hypothetical protein
MSDLTKIITWRYIRILIKSKHGILWKFLGRLLEFLQMDRQNMAHLQTAFWNVSTRTQHQLQSVHFNISPSTAALSRNEPASSGTWRDSCCAQGQCLNYTCIATALFHSFAFCYIEFVVCAWVHIHGVGYWVTALISLESIAGITAGGPAVVIEICLLWCGVK